MPLDLEAIRKRVEAATPGPWEWVKRGLSMETYSLFAGEDLVNYHGLNLINTEEGEWDWNGEANRALLAHARQDIPDLLSRIEELESQLSTETSRLRLLLSDTVAVIEKIEAENDSLRDRLPRWIPVSERLPEMSSTVLIYAPNGNYQKKGLLVEADFVSGSFYHGFYSNKLNGVTHWMPLPAAPGSET
jgi:BMFP domain-containing protein YqiC